MHEAWARLAEHKAGVVGLFFILMLIVTAVAAPLLSGHDPAALSNDVMAPPSRAHWFGTDELGRDVFAGMSQGVQVSLTVGFVAALAASVLGTDPGFTSTATDDFVPLATSACVGAANDTVTGAPTAEYYENEVVTRMYRMRASAKDIGAFEHDTMGPGIGPYGSDGGVTAPGDAGTGGQGDGGTVTASDGGTVTGRDGGTESLDGSATTGDGGKGSSGSSGGCGCRMGAAGGAVGGTAWVLALVGLAWRRRRSPPSA